MSLPLHGVARGPRHGEKMRMEGTIATPSLARTRVANYGRRGRDSHSKKTVRFKAKKR